MFCIDNEMAVKVTCWQCQLLNSHVNCHLRRAKAARQSKINTDTDTDTEAKKAARNHQTAHETCQGKQKEINGESTTERNKTISVENLNDCQAQMQMQKQKAKALLSDTQLHAKNTKNTKNT